MLHASLEERLAIGPSYDESGLVFTTIEGSLLKPASFSQTFERLVAGTGLPKIRLHDLRHTHATLLLRAGVPVLVVSKRLGHATPGFTLTVYGHLLPGQDSDAAERFASVLRGSV